MSYHHSRSASVFVVILMILMMFMPAIAKSDINTLLGDQRSPSAAIAPDGTIYVVYADDRNAPDLGDIYISKSTDGGVTFDDPLSHVLIYNDDPSGGYQGQPTIAIDSLGIIHIAFLAGSTNSLYYISSSDGGLTFENMVRVSDAPSGTPSIAQYPNIAVDKLGEHVYIGWRDIRDIGNGTKAYYAVGHKNGGGAMGFSENRCIYAAPNQRIKQSAPSLAVDDSGTLFLAWHDNRTHDLNIYYAISRDYGETLEFPGAIDDSALGDRGQPSIAIDSLGRIWAAYSFDETPDGNLSSTVSAISVAMRDFNSTFGGYQTITSADGCLAPFISILDGGLVFVAYSEVIVAGQDTYRGMFYLSSIDDGVTWSNADQLDRHKIDIDNYEPAIIPQDSGQVLVVWEENNQLDGSGRNIVSTTISESFPNRMKTNITPVFANADVSQIVGFDVSVNDSAGPVLSALIQFLSDSGGVFSPVTELGGGFYFADYTVPDLPMGTKIAILPKVSKAGYPDSGAFSRLNVSDNLEPVAIISGPSSGEVNKSLSFDGSGSNDSDGYVVAYNWDFGDGFTATGPSVSHIWTSSGTYPLNLTVTDDAGATNWSIRNIQIMDMLQMTLSMNKTYLEVGGTALVTVSITALGLPIENALIQSYCKGEKFSNPVTVNPNSTYTDSAGKAYLILEAELIDHYYPEILYVLASRSGYIENSGSYSFDVLIPPVADFNFTGSELLVQFDASGSYDPDGIIFDYSWDFGDGGTGSGQMIPHSFPSFGSYNVTLTVLDDDSASDSITKTVITASALESAIIPYTNPIESMVTTPIDVQVTHIGVPVQGAVVVLTTSAPATITPSSAVTDANGIASFELFCRVRTDRMTTLTATASKTGYLDGVSSLDILLNYPDLYISYSFDNTSVLSGGSVNGTIMVTDLNGDPVDMALVSLFPDIGGTQPISSYTNASGLSRFTYLAPVVSTSVNDTVLIDVSKIQFEVNNSVNFSIEIIVVPLLEVVAAPLDPEYYWYENIFINATIELDGIPEANANVFARMLGGPGWIEQSPLSSDANGNVSFTYLTRMVLTAYMVFIELTAEIPGGVEGADYIKLQTVVIFKITAAQIQLSFVSYPAAVAPGDRINVVAHAADPKGNPIASLGVIFIFKTNISSDNRFRRTDIYGDSFSRATAPATDVPLEMNITISASQKGYFEAMNWTMILIDPALAGASSAAFSDDANPSVSVDGAALQLSAYAILFLTMIGIVYYSLTRKDDRRIGIRYSRLGILFPKDM